MNNKLVSVIVPVYNVERYLQRCIDSILAQTYPNLEIILVDDGSTDASPKLCDEYKKRDSRIRVFHQENKGLSAARNTGIELSCGEYLVFIDSDDYIHPQMIECLYKGIVDYEVTISICGIKEVLSEDKERSNFAKSRYTIYTDTYLFNQYYDDGVYRSMVIPAWNKMYHRNLFSEYKFPEGRIYEDTYTTPKILHNAGKICVNDSKMYFYLVREGSLSHSPFSKKTLRDYCDGYEVMYDVMSEINDTELICKCADYNLKRIYAICEKEDVFNDRVLWKYAHQYYKKAYKKYKKKNITVNWLIRFGLMRYMPKLYIPLLNGFKS